MHFYALFRFLVKEQLALPLLNFGRCAHRPVDSMRSIDLGKAIETKLLKYLKA